MLTVKQLLEPVQSNSWFTTIDLNSAYFHTDVARFAFQGVASKYSRTPFSNSLAARFIRVFSCAGVVLVLDSCSLQARLLESRWTGLVHMVQRLREHATVMPLTIMQTLEPTSTPTGSMCEIEQGVQ